MGFRGFFIAAVVAALVAWYLYDPVPRNFSEPKRLRAVLAAAKIAMTTARGLDFLGVMPLTESTGAIFRLALPEIDPDSYPDVKVQAETLEGVPVRLYRPLGLTENESGARGGLVYYHGGGWVMGPPRLYDTMIDLVRRLGLVVASVDYRLAPEHPFPAPLDDCLAATRGFQARAAEFGVDPEKVALAGDSAGGNLAAAVALKLRDDDLSGTQQLKHHPQMLLLIQPALQAVDFRLPSYMQNSYGPLVSSADNARFWSSYLAGHAGYTSAFLNNTHTSPAIKRSLAKSYLRHENLQMNYHYAPYRRPSLDYGDAHMWNGLQEIMFNRYVAPLLADDVTGLPKTHVITAHYDVVRDDGFLFLDRLEEAGNDVTHSHMAKGFQGLLPLIDAGFEESREIVDDVARFLKNL